MAQVPAPQHGTRAVLFHLALILVLQSWAHGAKLLDGSSSLAHDSSGDLSDPEQKMSGRRKLLLQKLHPTSAPEAASNFSNWPGDVFRTVWASTVERWHSIQDMTHAYAAPTSARKARDTAYVKAMGTSFRFAEFLGMAGNAFRGVVERHGFVKDTASTHAQQTHKTNFGDGFDKVREFLHRARSASAKKAAAGQRGSTEDSVAESAAKRRETNALAKRSKLPAHGRVAVIVRGRGFRGGRFTAGCMSSAWEAQKNETKSLIAKVVDPLLGRGNSVDLFISEASGRRCSLRKDLMALYSSFAQPPSPSTSNGQRTLGGMYTSMRQAPAEHSRHNLSSFYAEKPQIAMFLEKVPDQILLGDMYAQKREQQQQQQHRTALHVFQEDPPRSLSQGSGLISALDFFKRRAKRRQEYDLILVLRHDILWKIAIDQWKVTKDYTKLNFMSQCEPKTKILNCVNDVAWTMPGRMYDAFASSIGRGHCFNQTECSIERGMCHGHHCKEVMMNLTGSTQESYLTEWVPKRNLRDRSNPIAVLR